MKKLNEFTADSIWYIGTTKRTLKEWAQMYEIDLELVQERMRCGNTIHRALTKMKRQERRYSKPTLEELKAEYATAKPYVFDKDIEKNIPSITFSDAAKEREAFAFRLMYGKNNVSELSTY